MGSHIIAGLKYHDCKAAIAFLCEAFGFERHVVHEAEDASIPHAQLKRGDDMIMLGSVRSEDDPFAPYSTTPRDTGGGCTMSTYIIVTDVDAHHDRAVAAGAKVVYPPTDQDYGGRNYSALDPEGNIWHFGDYDPWA